MMSNLNAELPRWKPTRKDIALMYLSGILFVGQVATSFIYYNWAGIDVVLYIGWAIIGIAFFGLGSMARIAFLKKGASANKKKWLETTVIVDTGVYSIIRHPMYLSFMMYPVALMCISQHWLSVVLGIPFISYMYFSMISEERNNIKRFGDAYLSYMKKVPRMNIIAGFVRLFIC